MSRFAQTLQAIQALAGGNEVALLAYDHEARSLDLPDSVRLLHGFGAIDLQRMATALDGPASWSRDRLAWTESRDGGAILIIGGVERNGITPCIAIGFADTPSACRLRLATITAPLLAVASALLQLRDDVGELRWQQVAARTALDNLDYGVIAVRADRTPLMMNGVVQAMLAEPGPIQLHRGFLRPVDHREAIRFHVALDSVIGAGPGKGGKPREGLMLMLAGDRGGRQSDSMIMLIAPADGGAPEGAAALIYLFRPELSDVRGLEPLCQLLGLSGAETRLVTELLIGHTVAEAAVSMRVRLETARSYLKQVFVKTGTHRQTELVSLIHRYLLTVRGRLAFRAA